MWHTKKVNFWKLIFSCYQHIWGIKTYLVIYTPLKCVLFFGIPLISWHFKLDGYNYNYVYKQHTTFSLKLTFSIFHFCPFEISFFSFYYYCFLSIVLFWCLLYTLLKTKKDIIWFIKCLKKTKTFFTKYLLANNKIQCSICSDCEVQTNLHWHTVVIP